MRKWLALTTVVFVSALGAQALAQDVEAQREALMKGLGGAVRTLTQMSKGQVPFDQAAAAAAFTKLRDNARGIPAVFATPTPPGVKTEALPKIWEDMAGFTAIAKKLETDAGGYIQIASADAIGPALQVIGGSCGACHQTYRAKN